MQFTVNSRQAEIYAGRNFMNTIQNPGNLEISVTQDGIHRMPEGVKVGNKFPVVSITPGAVGDYWVVHVHDEKGNIWSLGDGQWAPVGMKVL